jgi:hypothetical protein
MDNVVLPMLQLRHHVGTEQLMACSGFFVSTQAGLHFELMSHASAQNHDIDLLAAAHKQNSPQPKYNTSAQSEHLGLWMISWI